MCSYSSIVLVNIKMKISNRLSSLIKVDNINVVAGPSVRQTPEFVCPVTNRTSKAHIPLKTVFALATKRNEIYTKNMKCTWPTRKNFALGTHYTYIPLTGFGVWRRGKANLRVCVGSKIPTCWYPQHKILG